MKTAAASIVLLALVAAPGARASEQCDALKPAWEKTVETFAANLIPAFATLTLIQAMPKGSNTRNEALDRADATVEKARQAIPALRVQAERLEAGKCLKSGNAEQFIATIEDMIATISSRSKDLR